MLRILCLIVFVPAFAAAAPQRSQERLDALLTDYDSAIAARTDAAALDARRDAIDREAGQKDAAWSRLFWHTDLGSARGEARRRGRPILSLRLLGRLDEEMSCANSRFFRVALYADTAINRHLRDNFVLHWQSVRDVPVMTVQFADGRQIRRPITGNSMHLILTSNGRVLDALPGMYSPQQFLLALQRHTPAAVIPTRMPALDFGLPPAFPRAVPASDRLTLTTEARPNAYVAAGVTLQVTMPRMQPFPRPARPDAAAAGRLAMSKVAFEGPSLRDGGLRDTLPPAVAVVDVPPVVFGANALVLMALKSGEPAGSEAFNGRMTAFRKTVRQDTQINERELRPRVLEMIGRDGASDPEVFTARVYRDVFLMPLDDAWAGLNPEDVFTALPREGVHQPVASAGR